MRAGLATGRVPARLGDGHGPVVTLATRLASLARLGTAPVDAELAAALRRRAGAGCRTGACGRARIRPPPVLGFAPQE